MKQLLVDAWFFLYEAFFRPSRLMARLEALGIEPSKDAKAQEVETFVSFRSVLWFNTRDKPASARMIMLFTLLVCVSTTPLLVAVLTLGRGRDLLIVIAAMLSAFGAGAFSPSLGLLFPPLFALMYVFHPSAFAEAVDHTIHQLPLAQRLGLGLVVGLGAIGFSSLVTERLLARGWKTLGSLSLLVGIWVGIMGGWKTAAPHAPGLGPVAILPILLSFSVFLKERDPSRALLSHTLISATFVVSMFGLGLLPSKTTSQSDLASGAAMLSCVILLVGVGGFLLKVPWRLARESIIVPTILTFTTAIFIGVLTPLVIFWFHCVMRAPLTLMFFMTWALGFGIAPSRCGSHTIVEVVKTTLAENGWRGLRHLPFLMLDHRPTRLFIISAFGVGALRNTDGIGIVAMLLMAMLVGYYRVLPAYPIAALSTFIASVVTRDPIRWLRLLPPHQGELLALPLPGHKDIFVKAFRADPSATMDVIEHVSVSGPSSVRFTIERALPEIESEAKNLRPAQRTGLVVERLGRVRATDELSWHIIFAKLYISDEDDAGRKDTAQILPILSGIAIEVEEALRQTLEPKREIGLERGIRALNDLAIALPQMGIAPEALSAWQPVVERWRGVLQGALDQMLASQPSHELVQVFQFGAPLQPDRPSLFQGREQLGAEVAKLIAEPGRPSIVLHGPRRVGKSSFLLNLRQLLPSDVIPAYIDVQSQAVTASEGDCCHSIARAIARALRHEQLIVPDREVFRAAPYPALEDWLDTLAPILDERRLLLCFDEFEKLGEAMRRGRLTTALFDELRHLIQHRKELGFIFCGAQTLEELGPQYTSYFINTYPVEVGNLDEVAARKLLYEPDPLFTLRYDPTIVETVLHETGCQPYLLQLVGAEMIKAANLHKARTVDSSLLEEALRGALTTGELYFMNIWDETSGAVPEQVAAGRRLLKDLALSHPIDPDDDLARSALQRLLRYKVVVADEAGYRIAIPLVTRWVNERAVV